MFHILLGVFIALVYALYEMLWLSPRGASKVDKIRDNR
jgi:hypothetical protein